MVIIIMTTGISVEEIHIFRSSDNVIPSDIVESKCEWKNLTESILENS